MSNGGKRLEAENVTLDRLKKVGICPLHVNTPASASHNKHHLCDLLLTLYVFVLAFQAPLRWNISGLCQNSLPSNRDSDRVQIPEQSELCVGVVNLYGTDPAGSVHQSAAQR